MHFETVTFFRPEEIKRESTTLPADLYNHSRLLLGRSLTDCEFVPIRSMQYQGVITDGEIFFVDAQGYAVRDGEGGRLIVMAWEMAHPEARESLSEPVPIEIVQYHPLPDDQRRRLQLEFGKAMDLMLERQLEASAPAQTLKVVPLRPA